MRKPKQKEAEKARAVASIYMRETADKTACFDELRERIDRCYSALQSQIQELDSDAVSGTRPPQLLDEIRTVDNIIFTSLFLYEQLQQEVEIVPVKERKKMLPTRQRALLAKFQPVFEANRRVFELRLASIRAISVFLQKIAETTQEPRFTWAAEYVDRIIRNIEPLPTMNFGSDILDWLTRYAMVLDAVEQVYPSAVGFASFRMTSLLMRQKEEPERKSPLPKKEKDPTWDMMLRLLIAAGLSDKDIRRRLCDAQQRFPGAFEAFSFDWLRLVNKYLREIHAEPKGRKKRRSHLR